MGPLSTVVLPQPVCSTVLASRPIRCVSLVTAICCDRGRPSHLHARPVQTQPHFSLPGIRAQRRRQAAEFGTDSVRHRRTLCSHRHHFGRVAVDSDRRNDEAELQRCDVLWERQCGTHYIGVGDRDHGIVVGSAAETRLWNSSSISRTRSCPRW